MTSSEGAAERPLAGLDWRARALDRALRVLAGFWLLLLLWLVVLWRSSEWDAWPSFVAMSVTTAAVAIAAYSPSLPLPVRVAALFAPGYATAVVGLLSVGYVPGPVVALTLTVCTTAVFLSPRWAAAATASTILPFAVGAGLAATGWNVFDADMGDYFLASVAWNRSAVTTGLVMVVAAVVVSKVVSEVEAARAAQAAVLGRLAEEAEAHVATARERERMERELVAAQKMDALGKLAMGVAHDFHNQLTVVLGWIGLLEGHDAPSDALVDEGLEAIVRAASEGAEVTGRLLAVSPGRADGVSPHTDVRRALADQLPTLAYLFPEDMGVTVDVDRGAVAAMPPGPFAQLSLVLALSCRAHLPPGGRLHIEGRLVPDAHGAAGASIRLRFVRGDVAIASTGAPARAPVDATATAGDPRGLTAAVALVEGVGGRVRLVDIGALGPEVQVFLPVALPVASEDAAPTPEVTLEGRVVLLADDDASIRRLLARALRDAGATVLSAAHGAEAVARARGWCGPLDLLCLDGIMPGMSTAECVRELCAQHPEAALIILSGHLPEELASRGLDLEHATFLSKPVATEVLIARMAEALGRVARAGSEEEAR